MRRTRSIDCLRLAQSATRRWPGLLELPQYFLVSCCALAVDAGVLLLLSGYCQLPYLLAATASFLAGGAVGYLLCIRVVWKIEAAGSRAYEATAFILLGLVGLGLNALIMFATVSGWHLPVLIGKGISAACTFMCNYWLRRRWVFPTATRRILSWLPLRASQ